MKVKLAGRKLHIDAPREMVFQMMSAIGKGSLPGSQGESSRVLSRDGDTLTAEFLTPSGKRIYRTVEDVRLYPPPRAESPSATWKGLWPSPRRSSCWRSGASGRSCGMKERSNAGSGGCPE